MSSFSYSPGSGAILSLKGFEVPSHRKERKPYVICSEDIAAIDRFDSEIDEVVEELFDEVLNKIVGFFKSDVGTPHFKNSATAKLTPRKLMMAIVRCNFSDVGRITDGVTGRLQREIGSTVVLKPGDTNIFGVVNKLRSENEKAKRLLIVEQGESLSPQLLNGLFYSLSTISSNIIVLLCLRMSTKRATFFSAMSRRVLASLDVRCYSISSSDEVFDRLASAVLLNPEFTNLRVEPSFARFLRSSFFRDDFSISFVKKSLRFALMQHLWRTHKLNSKDGISEKTASDINEYMDVLTFLHSHLFEPEDGVEQRISSSLLKFHEDLQLEGFSESIGCSSEYKYWTQSLKQMSNEELSQLLKHKGIAKYGIELDPVIPDDEASENSSGKPLEKTSVLRLKEMMRERISATQRNPQTLARQKAVKNIEDVLRSVLRPLSSLPHSSEFLIGGDTAHSLTPNVVQDVEESMVSQKRQLLSIALHALLKQGRWKTVSLSEWGKTFAADCAAEGVKADETQVEQMFFACVGQFELIGIIRSSSDRETPSVTIAHHVLSSVI